ENRNDQSGIAKLEAEGKQLSEDLKGLNESKQALEGRNAAAFKRLEEIDKKLQQGPGSGGKEAVEIRKERSEILKDLDKGVKESREINETISAKTKRQEQLIEERAAIENGTATNESRGNV